MLRVQRNQLGSSSLPPAHADGAQERTPAGVLSTTSIQIALQQLSTRLISLGRVLVRVTEMPTTVRASSMGELMSPSLTFFVWSEPVPATVWTEEHRFLPTSEIRRERRWRFRPHDTAEAVD